MADRITEVHAAGPRGRRGAGGDEQVTIEVVTPDMAQEWLGLNMHNRNKSKATIDRYTRDMEADAFPFTGDAFRFNGNGALIDGQHRLEAIVKSGKPLRAIVIRGLPLNVQERLDQGKMRNVYDHLMLRGVDAAGRVGAAARSLLMIKVGALTTQKRRSNAEVLETVDRHPNLVDSVSAVGSDTLGVSPALLTALHYVGSHMLGDRESADSFVGVFSSGAPAYEGDPAHLWRERLVSVKRKDAFMRRSTKHLGTFHAWNLHRKRHQLQRFVMPEEAEIEGLDVNLI